jgi:hypothetical protein
MMSVDSDSFRTAVSSEEQPQCNNKEEEEDWTAGFLRACEEDATQVALDLVQLVVAAKDCGRRRSMLETVAHRILQELMLLKQSGSSSLPTTTTTTTTTTVVPNVNVDAFDKFAAPYSATFHAELGDSAFEILWDILRPAVFSGGRTLKPSINATCLFGAPLAEALIPKYQKLQTSGMLYSSNWKSTTSTSTSNKDDVAMIPDDLLLVCLPHQRLIGADTLTLNRIIRDFGVASILKEAMDDWGLQDDYPTVYTNCSRNHSNLGFSNTNKSCLQCLVFVARAYKCMYALQWTNIRDSLALKVLRCLAILQGHLEKQTLNQTTAGGSSSSSLKEPPATESKSNSAGPEQHNLAPPLAKVMEMPVERLCLTTGNVLERFDTAEAGRKSITHPTSQEFFEQVLRSDNPYHPRTYDGFLWRLKGASPLSPHLFKPQEGTVTKPPTPVKKRRLDMSSDDGYPTKRSKPADKSVLI